MDDQEGLIREVNEAMRQEKMQHFFTQFGRYIVMASGVIIFATLGYVWWQSSITARHEDATQRFYHAVKMVEEGKSYPAREAFDAIAKGEDASLAILAKLWLVKLKYEGGKPEKATEMAERILLETKGHPLWSHYRDWLTLYIPASEANQDILTKQSVYRLTNMERLASAHMRDKHMDKATELFEAIAKDSETPSTMRERANLILSTVLKDAVQKNALPAPDTIAEPTSQPATGL